MLIGQIIVWKYNWEFLPYTDLALYLSNIDNSREKLLLKFFSELEFQWIMEEAMNISHMLSLAAFELTNPEVGIKWWLLAKSDKYLGIKFFNFSNKWLNLINYTNKILILLNFYCSFNLHFKQTLRGTYYNFQIIGTRKVWTTEAKNK